MAALFRFGSIQWLTSDALNSTKVISGLGFPPRAMTLVELSASDVNH